jgi:hypothetical protein
MTIGIKSSVRGPYVYKSKSNEKEFTSFTVTMLGDCSLIDESYICRTPFSKCSVSPIVQDEFLRLTHNGERKPENVSRALTKLKYGRHVTPHQESLVRAYYYVPETISASGIYDYYRSNWTYNSRLDMTKYDIKRRSICSLEKLSILVKQLNLPLRLSDFLEVDHINQLPEDDTYLIYVESDEHAYVTDNLISHNCSGRICRADTTFSQQHFYILEVEKTIDSYRIALFKDHLSLLDRMLGKECRGTLTCDYVEIDRMNMKELKRSLLWRTK